MAICTPRPARSRAGALRKEPATPRSSVSRKAAAGNGTPIRGRIGAKLLDLRGFSSASPQKNRESVRAASIVRAARYSPRSLLKAKSKGTLLRRERATSDSTSSRASVPKLKLVKMISYKERLPAVDMKAAPTPRPFPRTCRRENFDLKGCKAVSHGERIYEDTSESDDDQDCFSTNDQAIGIKFRVAKGSKVYTNGKRNHYLMLKKAHERSALNG